MGLLDQVNAAVAGGFLGGTGQNYPKPVPGRVVHIDADFLAYQVSAESRAELDPQDPTPRKSLEDMQHNAQVAVEHIMRLAAGSAYHLHTTPSGSTKGGRHEQAFLKEYQANRAARDNKPEFLDAIRAYLIAELGSGGRGTAHLDQEADDGMAAAAWDAYYRKEQNLCVVASKDKDLRMTPGLHLIDDEIVGLDGTFGWIELDRSKSSPKVIGRGTKFFWAQLLMGDSADNISGLPAMTGKWRMKIKPTKAYLTALAAGKHDVVAAIDQSVGPCGAVSTYEVLADAKNDREAFNIVKSMWSDLGNTGHVFEHWRTGTVVSARQALASDMMLLWMRRKKDKHDVIHWLKETLA